MGAIPERPAVAHGYRALLTFGERFIPIPAINPSWWSLLGVFGSAACLFTPSPAVKFVLVVLVLITDWYDGATARRLGTTSREGYMVDVCVDRFSEALIFVADVASSPAARVFFVLWIVNTVLTLWSASTGRHRILPLRFAYLVVLAAQVMF